MDLSAFKAYDVRGIYPETVNEEIAYATGRAFATFLAGKRIAVGRDMRLSGKKLAEEMMRGITECGVEVIDLGLISSDMLYFAVGQFDYDGGVMITASHNPKEYNGFKFCREQAIPISSETGLFEIRDLISAGTIENLPKRTAGKIVKKNILSDWVNYTLKFIDPKVLKPLKIVVDAGNGMAGLVWPEVAKDLPMLKIVPLYFELDGNFPNHPANPAEEANLVDLKKKVLAEGADLGLAFDGDADRLFCIDEKGEIVTGTEFTALISQSLLRKHAGEKICYNLNCGSIVPETILANGGKAIRTRVGHSYVKAKMREENAIFGGEATGHYYFRDNFYADSALIAALLVLELLSSENEKLSALIKPFQKYYLSGEINSTVTDKDAKLKLLKETYADGQLDLLDGVTITYPDFSFNVRASNTEPLLRLNLEAKSKKVGKEELEKVLELIRS